MDYAKLKEFALAASPGPWTLHRKPAEKYVETLTGASHYDTEYIAVVCNAEKLDKDDYRWYEAKGVVVDNAGYYSQSVLEEDAEFMVAANPSIVLALLSKIETLENQLATITSATPQQSADGE